VLHTASLEDIRAGKVTDVYFPRTVEILRRKAADRHVVAEVTASSLPEGYAWAILAGVAEVAVVLEGLPLDVDAASEGSLFCHGEPVLRIAGNYVDVAV